MKNLLTLIFSLALGMTAQADSSWRTFTSSDGARTFEGRLTAYNASTQTVTVENRQGQTLHFKEDLISEDDREYVLSNADKLPPEISLDVRFEKLLDRGDSKRTGGSRTTTSDAGYKIALRNFTPERFSDVEVEYLMIYRKDQVSGSGTNQVVRGSESVTLEANRTHDIETESVSLVSFYEAAKASSASSGGGCSAGRCPKSSSSTTVTRAKRSRDYLVGCIARVTVNGHVVATAATAPNLLRQYQAELDGSASSKE